MCPAAAAACSIHRGSQRKKAARTHETEHTRGRCETENVQGDPFIGRMLELLVLTEVVLHVVYYNSG